MSLLNWPSGWDRTPEHERERTNKFDTGLRQTRKELRRELERMDVDEYRVDTVSGRGNDPGVVVRWTKHGAEHAVACDHYDTRAANARSVYLWIRETRLRSDRPVRTGNDEFAAARLPPAEGVDAIAAPAAEPAPHEVLQVAPDASDDVVRAAARRLSADAHPDSADGDEERFKRVQKAKDAMLADGPG